VGVLRAQVLLIRELIYLRRECPPLAVARRAFRISSQPWLEMKFAWIVSEGRAARR